MDRKKITMGKILKLPEMVPYLESLTAAFKKGQISVRKGEDELLLCPQGQIFLSIEAKKKKHSERFSFEISWDNLSDQDDIQDNFTIVDVGTKANLSGSHAADTNKNTSKGSKDDSVNAHLSTDAKK